MHASGVGCMCQTCPVCYVVEREMPMSFGVVNGCLPDDGMEDMLDKGMGGLKS